MMAPNSISVCLATIDRPHWLKKALESLTAQEQLASEIIVSDASMGDATRLLVEDFARQYPECAIKHVRSERKALPFQRWWALTHASGEIVLFMDDDMRLAPSAVAVLSESYATLDAEAELAVAGVGFQITFGDHKPRKRVATARKERWLGTSTRPSGTMTPGGLDISLSGVSGDRPVRVDQLSGGAMSFRRSVLQRVGPLDRLWALYEAGIGRAEDVVLSSHARKYGRLYLITGHFAFHPPPGDSVQTAYATQGWRWGMTETWGRAHTLRWMATERSAYRHDWSRLASLELARSTVAVAKRPWKLANWTRLLGGGCGVVRTLVHWSRIPERAASSPPAIEES